MRVESTDPERVGPRERVNGADEAATIGASPTVVDPVSATSAPLGTDHGERLVTDEHIRRATADRVIVDDRRPVGEIAFDGGDR